MKVELSPYERAINRLAQGTPKDCDLADELEAACRKRMQEDLARQSASTSSGEILRGDIVFTRGYNAGKEETQKLMQRKIDQLTGLLDSCRDVFMSPDTDEAAELIINIDSALAE